MRFEVKTWNQEPEKVSGRAATSNFKLSNLKLAFPSSLHFPLNSRIHPPLYPLPSREGKFVEDDLHKTRKNPSSLWGVAGGYAPTSQLPSSFIKLRVKSNAASWGLDLNLKHQTPNSQTPLGLKQPSGHIAGKLQCLVDGPPLGNQTLDVIRRGKVHSFRQFLDLNLDQTFHGFAPYLLEVIAPVLPVLPVLS